MWWRLSAQEIVETLSDDQDKSRLTLVFSLAVASRGRASACHLQRAVILATLSISSFGIECPRARARERERERERE